MTLALARVFLLRSKGISSVAMGQFDDLVWGNLPLESGNLLRTSIAQQLGNCYRFENQVTVKMDVYIDSF